MDVLLAECDNEISLCFLVARNSFVCPPGADGPRPMAIFELLDYIVNEVCYQTTRRWCQTCNSLRGLEKLGEMFSPELLVENLVQSFGVHLFFRLIVF